MNSRRELPGEESPMSSLHQDGGTAQATASLDILASDADREATVGLLAAAFAEGRLTADEHAERIQSAYAARSWASLNRLTADLPAQAAGPSGPPPDADPDRLAAAPGPPGIDWCLACLLLICCPPAGIAWLMASRRRARPSLGPAAARAHAGSGRRAEDR
jgi:hypothetical protein